MTSSEGRFTFTSSLSEEQERRFAEPFTIQSGETTTVVFQFDTGAWFVEGDRVLDPRDPQNRDEIENNIKAAFDVSVENGDGHHASRARASE